jgi:hypothetical protein
MSKDKSDFEDITDLNVASKPRGRPRGSVNKVKDKTDFEDATDVDAVPKPRGRPRGSVNKVKDKTNFEDATDVDAVPKPRGSVNKVKDKTNFEDAADVDAVPKPRGSVSKPKNMFNESNVDFSKSKDRSISRTSVANSSVNKNMFDEFDAVSSKGAVLTQRVRPSANKSFGNR